MSSLRIASIFLLQHGRIFVSQRHGASHYPGHWQNVGGKAETNEPLVLAAQRETREETGLDLEVTRFVELGRTKISVNQGGPYEVTAFLVYLADDEHPQQTEATKAGPWVAVRPTDLQQLRPIVPALPQLTRLLVTHLQRNVPVPPGHLVPQV